ncbi:MAG: DUF3098 domain-containing protein [Crocinitomicaceae bacterium]|jgi:hypothetical protein|tara:strand:+ start:771 stop:1049 length:279 start_codon:yes stop_codon:yes gene_type:complete
MKNTPHVEEQKDAISHFGFNKENYRWLYIGLAFNVFGFILMIGGGADNLDEFDKSALFSHVRITLAPILIVIGYILILYAIMKPNKKAKPEA